MVMGMGVGLGRGGMQFVDSTGIVLLYFWSSVSAACVVFVHLGLWWLARCRQIISSCATPSAPSVITEHPNRCQVDLCLSGDG